jgi:ribonuclease P protein component
VVIFLMRAVGEQGKFGVTASRRAGGAVVRSRCKRRLRELYRIHRYDFEWLAVDAVINAHGSVASVPWPELERDFLTCARRAFEKIAPRLRHT